MTEIALARSSRIAFFLAMFLAGLSLADPPAASPAGAAAKPVHADKTVEAVHAAAWTRLAPESVDDLKAIQQRVQEKLAVAQAATVGVLAGGGAGSGVIVSADGIVLTAGHVSGPPGRAVRLVLADGKTVRGRSLGLMPEVDAGMIKIEEPGPYPVVTMGKNSPMKLGSWCFAVGHPGGVDEERGPVVRVGRVIANNEALVWTDCKLLGGDSGGPLFDLDGNVIGIHSRISLNPEANYHAPIDAYTANWDRLVAGQMIETKPASPPRRAEADPDRPMLGVYTREHAEGAVVTQVVPGSAAERAGVRVGDVVTRFAGERVSGHVQLVELIGGRKIDEAVEIEVLRDGERVQLQATLSRWKEAR